MSFIWRQCLATGNDPKRSYQGHVYSIGHILKKGAINDGQEVICELQLETISFMVIGNDPKRSYQGHEYVQ